MNDEVFRKKSLDKMKSPENLNDYIHVTNPAVWLILVGVVVLLIGACVWGIFGYIDGAVDVSVTVDRGIAQCLVQEDAPVKEGSLLRVSSREALVSRVENAEDVHERRVIAAVDLPDGTYYGEIITERIHPISFVLN